RGHPLPRQSRHSRERRRRDQHHPRCGRRIGGNAKFKIRNAKLSTEPVVAYFFISHFEFFTDMVPERYSRQVRFAGLGEEGPRRLMASRVTLVGCGALGTVLANSLVRAGVGSLRLIDRDFIETNNLQRQILFDEDDVAANLPKAEAAALKLRRINS